MADTLRPLTAEFLGTFALVFIGASAVIADTYTAGGLGLVGVALAHALVYAVMVTATMGISGGHINPAVTFGLLLARKIDGKTAAFYVVAQLAGAIVAALLVKALFPAVTAAAVNFGTPRIAADLSLQQAILIEGILTLFLISAVFGTAVASDAPKVGGFAIGLVLLFAMLAGAPWTGAALNPARAFGPALVAQSWEGHLAYWIGPLLGAAAGAVLWAGVLLPRKPEGKPAR